MCVFYFKDELILHIVSYHPQSIFKLKFGTFGLEICTVLYSLIIQYEF